VTKINCVKKKKKISRMERPGEKEQREASFKKKSIRNTVTMKKEKLKSNQNKCHCPLIYLFGEKITTSF
jgi:hypothetical protein